MTTRSPATGEALSLLGYGGATRLIPILGDPIAQVKSPLGLTRALQARGRDQIVVPLHVTAEALPTMLAALDKARNVDGLIATVPHKFAAFRYAKRATQRAGLLGSANVLRRLPDGGWEADLLDGLAMLRAITATGVTVAGRHALLVGAGGAGSAIGLALLEAGVAGLAVHDSDARRRDALLAKLRPLHPGRTKPSSASPAGYDLVVNASPAGMRPEDPLPVRADALAPGTCVADVITAPEMTPLLRAARAAGCRIQTGVGMFTAGLDLMADFFEGEDPAPSGCVGAD